MISLRLSFAAAILMIFCFTCRAGTPLAKHVFIISFDQAVPEVIQKTDMPVFKQMVAEGAHTWEAYTIVPSVTLPSHVSMLTGVGIQKHQVLWNDWNEAKGVVKVPTIFGMAKEKGLKTAMFAGKEKFKHLNVPGSLDAFAISGDATRVAEDFAAMVGELKPNLCLLHFADPDTTGHQFGVNSPEQIAALIECDQALKTIRDAVFAAGLGESSVFILTSDHGGHNIKNSEGKLVGTHSDATSSDVEIPWVICGAGVKKGFTITAPVVTYDTAATALWLLGLPVPEDFWGKPVVSALTQP